MLKRYSLVLFFMVIGVQFILMPVLKAQSVKSIEKEIGGGSSAVNNDESDPNTILYVAAGLVVVGALIYKFILEEPAKDEPESEEAQDESSEQINRINSIEKEIMIVKEKIPVDLHIGVIKNKFAPGDNAVMMGVTFNF